MPSSTDLIKIITDKDYGEVTTQENAEDNVLISAEGGYEILFKEITGWKD